MRRLIPVLLSVILAALCLAVPAMASAEPAASQEPATEETPAPEPARDDAGAAEALNGLVTGEDGKVYCYADGQLQQGLVNVDGYLYYFSATDGHRMSGGMVNDGTRRYYLAEGDGHVLMGQFVSYQGERYWLSPDDGHVMKNGFITVQDTRYYLAPSDGHVVSVGRIVTAGGRTYYPSAGDGHILTDCVIEDGGRFYYLDAKDGHVLKGGWISSTAGSRLYYAGTDGALYTGFCTVGKRSYYFDPNSARVRRGGIIVQDGRLYYLSSEDGHVMTGGWIKGAGGKRYYAGADGALYTGTAEVDGRTYVFDEQDGHYISGPSASSPLENWDIVHRLSQESRGSCLATSYSMAANLVLGYDKYGAFDWCAPGSDAANIYGSLKGTDGYTYTPALGGYSYDALVKGIDEAIAGGWPIVVSVRGTSTASTHYVLLVGYADSDHSDYLIVDPAGGGDASIQESAVTMRGYRHYELGNRNGTYMYVSFTRSK